MRPARQLVARVRRPVGVVVGLVLVATALGCGTTSPRGAASGSQAAASDGAFPVTLEHHFGSTTIERKPVRIVTLGEDLDTLAAVGITPVGYAPTAPGYTDDTPYVEKLIDLSDSEVLKGWETGEFAIEQIAGLRPDLILGTNLATMDKLYDRLSAIAPTVAYEKGWGEASWQRMSTTIGKAVGEPEKVAAAIGRSERRLADHARDLEGLRGKTVASVYHHSAGTFASNPRSASMTKYTELGMRVDPKLLKVLPAGATSNSVSMENIDALDADLLVISYGTPGLRASLRKNPLYQHLGVVRRGHVYEVPADDRLETFAGNSPTLLNVPWLLDRQRKVLTKVAADG